MLNCNTDAADGQFHYIAGVAQYGQSKRKVHIVCYTEMGHWSYVTFDSVKAKLNRAMNNDQITSNALLLLVSKEMKSNELNAGKFCALQIVFNWILL